MSRSYTTSQDRSRRRMLTVALVVGVVVIVGWVAAVAALAGGSRGSQQGGAEGAASDSSGQEQPEEGQEASANPSPENASPGNASPETTAEQNAEPAPQPTPDQGEGAETSQAIAGQTQAQDVFDPLEEQTRPTGEAASESGGASSQQEGSTPEEQPGPDGLTETEKTQARAASERYIAAAYGYSGGSADAYLQGIEQTTTEAIYDSPGGSMLKGYSQAAPECGMKSTALLEQFEVIGQSPEGLDVTVTFSVEDADGQVHQFRQQQRLTSAGDGYAVSGVSVEELISETSPTQSCPGSQSEQADGEEGEPQVEPADLSSAESERARAAAERFITSVYGYTGGDGKEYRERIARTADEETIYSSPVGQRLEEYAKAAEEEGMKSAAVMESFEITSVTGEATEGKAVEGTAYFRVAESYDRYGELKGEGVPYKQDLTLTPSRSTYEVSSAGTEQRISERQITAGHAKKTS